MQLVRIPAGTFLMGAAPGEKGALDTERRHPVTITRPYYLGVFEVTQGQYQRLMGSNPSAFSRDGKFAASVRGMDTSNFPVETITHAQAVRFCEVLSRLPEEKRRGRVYRLPTEAEWERAARAGSNTTFTFGSSLSSRLANFNGGEPYDAPKGPWLRRTTAVGGYKPNAWGLYDVHGNVWEWCADWYQANLPEGRQVDPAGPATGTHHLLRGGCWRFGGTDQRLARRGALLAGRADDNVGFRVLLVHP
jgi:formylglycine-generating enzyme required for sulfatase activity